LEQSVGDFCDKELKFKIPKESDDYYECSVLLDRKFLSSSKRTFEDWLSLAKKQGWVKIDE